jgi:hypothetical protein
MVDWTDPETFWLNVTNAGLGLVVLAAVLALIGGLGYEAMAWVRNKALKRVRSDAHVLTVPGLGITMADGGESLDPARRDAADEKTRTETKH